MKPVGIVERRTAFESLEVVSDVEGGFFVAEMPLRGRLIASKVIEVAVRASGVASSVLEDPALLDNLLTQGEEAGLYTFGKGVVVSLRHDVEGEPTQIVTTGWIRELWPPNSDLHA